MRKKKEYLFGCKCIFLHTNFKHSTVKIPKGRMYEESVFLVQAKNKRMAQNKINRMVKHIALGPIKFCGLVSIYSILAFEAETGTEIFSAFRVSTLTPQKYIRRFYFSPSCFDVGFP